MLRLVRNLVSHFPVGLAHLGIISRQNESMLLSAGHQGHGYISHSSDCKLPDLLDKHPQIYFGEGKKYYQTRYISILIPIVLSHQLCLIFWPSCETAKLTHQNLKVQKLLHIFQVTEPSQHYTLRKEKTTKQ